MALARIAETRQEQRNALEQVLVFEPHNQAALRGLARFNELNTPPASAPIPPRTRAAEPATPPAEEDEAAAIAAEESEIHWPLYAVVGVAVLVVFVAYLLLRPSHEATSGQPTPPLPGAIVGAATAEGMPTPPLLSGSGDASAPTSPAASPLAPTLPAVLATAPMTETLPATLVVTNTGVITSAITAEAPAAPAPTVAPTATEPPPGPTVAAQLPFGQLVTAGPWTASLLSADHAKMLDGSIGSLQPQSRFVLALVSVANSDTTPKLIPENLFTLVDSKGRHYQPIPAASAAYLQAYGQAQAGDFSMEQPIPGSNRTWSVPIIFDVPSDVQSLTLQVGGTSPGWPVDVAAPPAPTNAAG
jgi:hypothetical protein